VALDRARERLVRASLVRGRQGRRLRELGLDHRIGDGLLRIERGKPAREIFQFAHVARPAVPLEPFHRRLIELLARQPFPLDQRQEVPDQVRHVLDVLPQRGQPQRHDIEAEEQVLAEQALLDQKRSPKRSARRPTPVPRSQPSDCVQSPSNRRARLDRARHASAPNLSACRPES